MNWNWNILNWIQEQLPAHLRRIDILRFIWAALAGLRGLKTKFDQFRRRADYEASLNAIVIVMEAGLNRLISQGGTGSGSVSIEDADDNRTPAHSYNESELASYNYSYSPAEGIASSGWSYSYTEAEFADSADFYAVWFGTGLNFTQLAAFVNQHRAAGKRWKFKDGSII